jgi:hypothetical protein
MSKRLSHWGKGLYNCRTGESFGKKLSQEDTQRRQCGDSVASTTMQGICVGKNEARQCLMMTNTKDHLRPAFVSNET